MKHERVFFFFSFLLFSPFNGPPLSPPSTPSGATAGEKYNNSAFLDNKKVEKQVIVVLFLSLQGK